MATGHVVILNGTSSSGKTTLAHRLHDLADELWLVTGQDDFTKSLLPHYVQSGEAGTAERPEGFLFARDLTGSVHVEVGPTGRRVLAGYRRAVAALAHSGTNVVVAEAKFDPSGGMIGPKLSMVCGPCGLASGAHWKSANGVKLNEVTGSKDLRRATTNWFISARPMTWRSISRTRR